VIMDALSVCQLIYFIVSSITIRAHALVVVVPIALRLSMQFRKMRRLRS